MIQKLNARERGMLIVVIGIVVLFILSLLISGFRKNYASVSAEVETRQQELESVRTILKDAPLWQEREVWLAAKQPVMENRDRASVDLLEEIRRTARQHGVLIERPEIAAPTSEPSYQAIKVSVETRSDWPSLITFLNELQQPERFIVFEDATLRIDSADPTKMHAVFKIAKWYAPGE